MVPPSPQTVVNWETLRKTQKIILIGYRERKLLIVRTIFHKAVPILRNCAMPVAVEDQISGLQPRGEAVIRGVDNA